MRLVALPMQFWHLGHDGEVPKSQLADGPLLPRVCAATCPQPAKADAASAADPLVDPPKLAFSRGARDRRGPGARIRLGR
jgi:hypothetical protein